MRRSEQCSTGRGWVKPPGCAEPARVCEGGCASEGGVVCGQRECAKYAGGAQRIRWGALHCRARCGRSIAHRAAPKVVAELGLVHGCAHQHQAQVRAQRQQLLELRGEGCRGRLGYIGCRAGRSSRFSWRGRRGEGGGGGEKEIGGGGGAWWVWCGLGERRDYRAQQPDIRIRGRICSSIVAHHGVLEHHSLSPLLRRRECSRPSFTLCLSGGTEEDRQRVNGPHSPSACLGMLRPPPLHPPHRLPLLPPPQSFITRFAAEGAPPLAPPAIL